MQKIKKFIPLIVIFLAIFFDQWFKIYIKLNFTIGENVKIFSWFYIWFVENPGMAFGLTLGSKLFLTLFRIFVSCFIVYYIYRLVKINYKTSYIIVVSLVLAGAMGNIVDSIFYGALFSESTYTSVAQWLPDGGGYAPFFMGKVVDMFYFPIFTFPDWVPLLGGQIFFSPVFNLADSYITVSVFLLIIFFHKDFSVTIDMLFPKKEKVSSKKE